ncbi:MAG: cytochrome c biogenesis protein CcsA [Chloroflexota bacterium]|nr:cytochrome c biogenesis protein CcsA [Chloroflexota bacterium]
MADIGYATLTLALIFAIYSAIASVIGARRGNHRLAASARNGSIAVLIFFTLAIEIMLYSLITDNFGINLVASHSSKDLPLLYKFTALYSDKAGSLMFWGWLISIFTVILIIPKHSVAESARSYALSILSVTLVFFLILVTVVLNVFEKPALLLPDGHGLNPALQNPGMLIHPPLLFLGYAGFAIVFAFALSVLISRSTHSGWIGQIRQWALFAWCTLGLSNLVGAWWAHDNGAWGGYWVWDPVENASLMPWLLGTAFLHSIAMQRKRSYLKTWSMVLIVFTFAFTLLSPFITHGGIESPLHGFDNSPVPPYILSFIIVVLAGSLSFIVLRRKQLQDDEKPLSFVSREGAFLLTNIVLALIVLLIFLGTIIPGIAQAISDREVIIERSFFDRTAGPALLILVLLMGVCPLLGWRRSSIGMLRHNFVYPALVSSAMAIAVLISGIGNWYAIAALVCGFPFFTIIQEWFRGTKTRHRTQGEYYLKAFLFLIWGNRPRYGGFTVHLGIILITVGVIGSSLHSNDALINAMWAGGGIMLLGGIIAFWPQKRYFANTKLNPREI